MNKMNTRATSNEAVKVPTIYGNFYSWKNDLITRQLTEYSAHTRNELAMLNSFIKKGDTIIDVGGHIGTYSIPFAKKIGKLGRVFTFEGNPNNFALLEKNITINGMRSIIQAFNAVVSQDEASKFEMELPDGGNSGMYYFSSVVRTIAKKTPVINIDNWFNGLSKKPKVNLIKIDVEGAEVEILRSCEKLIKKFKPILYIEISQEALKRFDHSIDDLHQILSKEGYQYYKNIGERNSNNDLFKIKKLASIDEGGEFFDLLAFHERDSRKPSELSFLVERNWKEIVIFIRRGSRKLVSMIK